MNAAKQWLRYINIANFKEIEDKELYENEPTIDFSYLEKLLNYKFKKPKYLMQAFTHASYLKTSKENISFNTSSDSYQILQYLGNGIVDYMISKYLYDTYPQADPCMLHKLKICCLNNQLFCVIAVDMKLDQYMKSSRSLSDRLEDYKECLRSLRTSIASDNSPVNLDDLDHNFVKVLSDVLEALIGEIAYESKDFDEVVKIFMPIFIPYFNIYATPLNFNEHPKCFLYDMIAKEKGDLKKIRWIKREKEDKTGFFITLYKGWFGCSLVAEQSFRYDNCIEEKRFFKKMLINVKEILDEYHKRIYKNNNRC